MKEILGFVGQMLLNKASVFGGHCCYLSSRLLHCPPIVLIQTLVKFAILVGLGFTFDYKFTSWDSMAKFSFPIGTFAFC